MMLTVHGGAAVDEEWIDDLFTHLCSVVWKIVWRPAEGGVARAVYLRRGTQV